MLFLLSSQSVFSSAELQNWISRQFKSEDSICLTVANLTNSQMSQKKPTSLQLAELGVSWRGCRHHQPLFSSVVLTRSTQSNFTFNPLSKQCCVADCNCQSHNPRQWKCGGPGSVPACIKHQHNGRNTIGQWEKNCKWWCNKESLLTAENAEPVCSNVC